MHNWRRYPSWNRHEIDQKTLNTLSSIYLNMKVWSIMSVSVQSVSMEYGNWNNINWYTRNTSSFVVVYAVNIWKANPLLNNTLRNVPLSRDLVLINWRDDVCLLLSHLDALHMCSSALSRVRLEQASCDSVNCLVVDCCLSSLYIQNITSTFIYYSLMISSAAGFL